MSSKIEIPIGAEGTQTLIVSREYTVGHFHPDMPLVLGTPFLIYVMEVAASNAMKPYLPEGWVSVGAEVAIKHLAPTPIGFSVTAKATVTECKGRLVTFSITAHDGVELVGEGTHLRGMVDRSKFDARVAEKRPA